jgi:hypothetical protein
MREARFYLQQDSRVRALLRVEFGRDLSFYLTPFAKQARYYWGEETLNRGEAGKSFAFHGQCSGVKAPRISFHESGQVHLKLGRNLAGPLQIPCLTNLDGQHIATLTLDAICEAPMHVNELKDTHSIQNYRIPVSPDVKNIRLVMRVAQHLHCLRNATACVLQIKDSLRKRHVLLGFEAIPQTPISERRDSPGVVVLGGWNPLLDKSESQTFYFVRGA